MKTFFEYMYYRIADLNFSRDYERAIISVSGSQLGYILNIYSTTTILLWDEKRKFTIIEFLGITTTFFILDYLNTKLLKNRFEEFEKRWGKDRKSKKVWGLALVFTFIFFSLGGVFISGWITGRLNF